MMGQPSEEALVLDTSAFFASAKRLKELLRDYKVLATFDLVIFEFLKVVEEEINAARASGNRRRLGLLTDLRARFPRLLRALEVQVTASTLALADVDAVYELLAGKAEADPADVIIWLKMQKQGWLAIASDDVDDYRRMGANVLPLRR